MNTSVIILAAGMGTRMMSSKSKVMHKIAGTPMVQIILDIAKLFSNDITIIASEENQHDIQSLGSDFTIAIQKERLGTGHAVQCAGDIAGDKILVLYGDTPLLTTATIKSLLECKSDITILGFKDSNPHNRYGRLICDGGSVKNIVEYKDATEEERLVDICNSGVFAFTKEAFARTINNIKKSTVTGEIYLTDAIEIANSQGLHCGFMLCDPNEVLGVNNREELSYAEYLMQQRMRKYFMNNGVTMIDPSSVFLSLDTKIENDVMLEPNIFIGSGVQINSNVTIKAFCHLENVIIDSETAIGPFARIRGRTTIGKYSKIGNFVEVKNAKLGQNTKAGHLAYIGDADINIGVNIGAGTVFCNYDGVNKNRSTIGGHVFIGSNTSIISPVSIADGALVAAGSVITKNIEQDAIGISRSEQKNISGGASRLRNKLKQ